MRGNFCRWGSALAFGLAVVLATASTALANAKATCGHGRAPVAAAANAPAASHAPAVSHPPAVKRAPAVIAHPAGHKIG